MEKSEFLERLKELTAQEDVLAVSGEVNELKSKFQDFLTEEERRHQLERMESEHPEEEETLPQEDAVRTEFFEIYNAFREKKTAIASAHKIEQETNLRLKKKLIERLKTLITELGKRKVQAIVLGCTELVLAVDVRANVLPVYDSTAIHARAAVEWMLADEEQARAAA